jgi:hypothetical protein
MTWNVENLLRVGDQGGLTTQAELDAKLASLAQVIDTQQPDVLASKKSASPTCSPRCNTNSPTSSPTTSSPPTPTSAASASPS